MVSLLARGVPRASIVKGLHQSVARRVASLLGRHGAPAEGGLYLDGGPASNRGLLEALEDELLAEVKVLPRPQYTVAYGAAISIA
jgi:activator of 2-hydroxyglutaryl-CoA dehydratase